MARGKRTVSNKQDLLREICQQLEMNCEPHWTSRGGTITGDALENILINIAIQSGVPPKYFGKVDKYIWRLLHKSISALTLSLEIINKPTIPYRIESFLFLLINAWELLLKAKIINESASVDSIQEKDNPDKSVGFAHALYQVFKSEQHVIRKNLIAIDELRNEAMHLFIPFVPPTSLALFQACILNYEKMLNKWFNRSLLERIPRGMMFLVANIEPVQFSLDTPLLSKHLTTESIEFLREWQKNIRQEMENLTEGEIGSFVIPINLNVSIVNNPQKADIIANWDRVASGSGVVAVKYQRITDKYPYTYMQVKEEIKQRVPDFKQKILDKIIREKNIKNNQSYSDYNFRSKKHEQEFKKTGNLATAIISLYNSAAIEYILQVYHSEYN